MKSKIYCPVCRVSFLYREELELNKQVICSVCGARLELVSLSPEIVAQRVAMDPREEILERIDNFARLRGYIFNEHKELVLEGLLEKFQKYGDFYCPCRFDNIPDNICPCLETRMNQVRKEGSCL